MRSLVRINIRVLDDHLFGIGWIAFQPAASQSCRPVQVEVDIARARDFHLLDAIDFSGL